MLVALPLAEPRLSTVCQKGSYSVGPKETVGRVGMEKNWGKSAVHAVAGRMLAAIALSGRIWDFGKGMGL